MWGPRSTPRNITRTFRPREQTVDFVIKAETASPSFQCAKRVFGQVSSGGPDALKALSSRESDEQISQLSEVTAYLNHCELVAVAIKSGALDETMYKMWNRSAYVLGWTRAHEYVADERRNKNHETLWKNFEDLAKQWDG